MDYHRLLYHTLAIFVRKCKICKKYLTHSFTKIRSNPKTFVTKMISAKSSTIPESFVRIGEGRRMNLATSDGFTQIYYFPSQSFCECVIARINLSTGLSLRPVEKPLARKRWYSLLMVQFLKLSRKCAIWAYLSKNLLR